MKKESRNQTPIKKTTSKNIWLIATSFIAGLVVVFTLILSFWLNNYWHQVLNVSEPAWLKVEKGTSLNKVCRTLKNDNWLSSCVGLKILRRFHPDIAKIKSGTYQVPAKSSLEDLILMLNRGDVHQFSFTIVEGDNVYQVTDKIIETDFIQNDIEALSLKQLTAMLGLSYDSPEGFLAPDTYFVTDGTPASELLKRAVSKQQERLVNAWEQRADLSLKTPYELLKLASIVEKESALDSERATIASVFYNRLAKKMRLQTDPTVIYGVWHKYNGDIKRSHLRETTPFNTYRINGLPATPIANPSLNSLLATALPKKTDYYYFVASGKGGHTFSRTLAEHNKAYKDYMAFKNKNSN